MASGFHAMEVPKVYSSTKGRAKLGSAALRGELLSALFALCGAAVNDLASADSVVAGSTAIPFSLEC